MSEKKQPAVKKIGTITVDIYHDKDKARRAALTTVGYKEDKAYACYLVAEFIKLGGFVPNYNNWLAEVKKSGLCPDDLMKTFNAVENETRIGS